MWVLGKIRKSMESIPVELNRYIGKNEEDIFFLHKTSRSQNLHSNIITPDNIPEFCLPPRLCKKITQQEYERTPQNLQSQSQIPKSNLSINTTRVKSKEAETKEDDALLSCNATKKPLPFSAECYGLAGIHESPNTRRKESLFHGKYPGYTFERRFPSTAHRLVKETNMPKKTLSPVLPLFSHKSLSETSSTESEASLESSLFGSPYGVKSPNYIPLRSGRLKGAVSCPSLTDNKDIKGRLKRGVTSLTTSPCSPPNLEKNTLTLSPPVLFPWDILHCQEKLQCEHVLLLQGRGKIRLTAEHTTVSNNTFSALSTVRVRVVSVEGLWDHSSRQIPNCAVNLCLTPGKLQQQESATIKNCRSPVFNEDFFFTGLTQKDLMELQLRVKVLTKPATGTLRSRTVIEMISKPLSQLLPVKKNT